jgi:hypothetical protein
LTVTVRLSGGTNASLRDGALARLFAASAPVAEAPTIVATLAKLLGRGSWR